MKKFTTFFLIFFMVLPGFIGVADSADVTLLQILSDPVKYHLKKVRAVGYLHLKRYDDAIYLHQEDYTYALYGNSLWIDVTDDMRNHEEKLSDRYVIIEGIFNAENRGPMGAHSGTIRKITRCEVWPEKSPPVRVQPTVVSTSGD